jgi:IS605 OrfB family transposase
MYPGRALRRRCARVLGVDLNPDHVAWCVVSTDGNPLAWGKVTLDLTGSAAQNADSIGRAVAKLISVARTHGAVIAHEELDFTRSRANLRYGCSRRLARLLSSFAYHKFFATLSSRARREQVAVVSVNPAWTSVLGQANYAGVYGVSVDQGAACVVARRALGLRTRVRPYVAHVLSRERGTGHTSSGQPGLKLVAKALPKRRSTWEPSGLCLRRHSAQIPGSRSGIEPHGVMVATRTGDCSVLGSQPAPTVARGHLGSQARQSHAVVPLPPRPVLRTQRDRHDPGDQHWSAMTNVDLSGE